MATNDKQDKKPPVKRMQMSGLQALKQNLGVGSKEVEPITPEVTEVPKIEQPEKLDQSNIQQNNSQVIAAEVPKKEDQGQSSTEVNLSPELTTDTKSVKDKLVSDGVKKPLTHFFIKSDVKSKKETVNITTAKRDALKFIAVLEKSTINDLMENMIDWFFETYYDEIIKKPGMKDLMKDVMKNIKK
jgi:hypothetical protein